MPTKAELYAQMADKVATQLTGSWQEWAGFLTTATRRTRWQHSSRGAGSNGQGFSPLLPAVTNTRSMSS